MKLGCFNLDGDKYKYKRRSSEKRWLENIAAYSQLTQWETDMEESGEQCTVVFALIVTKPASECVCGWGGNDTPRETREGWPLLTVEIELNGDSKSTNERSHSLLGSLGLSCRYKRFLFCLGCSSRPIFFSSYTISIRLFPIAQQAGRAAVLGRLSLSMCLWLHTPSPTSKFRNNLCKDDSALLS